MHWIYAYWMPVPNFIHSVWDVWEPVSHLGTIFFLARIKTVATAVPRATAFPIVQALMKNTMIMMYYVFCVRPGRLCASHSSQAQRSPAFPFWEHEKRNSKIQTLNNGSWSSQIKRPISSHLISSGPEAYPACRAVLLPPRSPSLTVMKSVMNVCVLILFY